MRQLSAEVDALVHIGDHGAGIQRGEYLPPGAVRPLAGLIKSCIPIDEQAYVQAKLAEKCAKLEAEIRLVHAALRGEPQLQCIVLWDLSWPCTSPIDGN